MIQRLSPIVRILYCWLLLAAATVALHGQQPDSLQRQMLQEVLISDEAPSVLRAQAPMQVVTNEHIEKRNAVVLSDVVRQMAGLTLKDYGGVGGMKTISARGLGSQFSTLTIDGIAVTDCQNGQIDVGRYLVGNSAFVSFANGQQYNLLQSARGYAAGNVLNMETQTPQFLAGEHTHLKAGFEGGSFGLISPSLLLNQRLSQRMSLSVWGNYLHSDGDYPYTIYYGRRGIDSSDVRRRENSQMSMATGEANLFYTITQNQHLALKAHYMQARHHLPGAVILYNTVKASESTEDQMFFAQTKYQLRFWATDTGAHRMRLQVLGKYQVANQTYDDTSKHVRGGTLHNDYTQRESYLSATLLCEPLKGLKISLAEDGAVNTLKSNLPQNNDVARQTSLTVLAAGYDCRWLSLSANLLGTAINEQAVSTSTEAERKNGYQRLSPFAGITLKPFRNTGLRVRYFFKENYRVPTFNELYYLVMTRALNPERALQHNLGITYLYGTESGCINYLSITADVYRNRVSDKIVAVPTHNMFVWSMINLGIVDVKGLDAKGEATLAWGDIRLTLSASYSYQQALDHTDTRGKTYGHQIPYTPLHSGVAAAYVETPWVEVGYDAAYVGERYSQKQNVEANLLEGYVDQGLIVARRFALHPGTLRLQAHLLNIFDVQYEVVRNYPMMGRNIRLSAVYEF